MGKRRNLENKKFGSWTVISLAGSCENGRLWECRCDCGQTSLVRAYALINGRSKSCGCTRENDLSGKKFGRLTVLSLGNKKGSRNKYWLCQCECGEKKEIAGCSLVNGSTKSCGCWKRDRLKLPSGQASMNVIRRNYTRIAKERNLQFKLSIAKFREITSSNCYYCNCTPSQNVYSKNGPYNGVYLYNGIDRVDNEKGYTTNNCVPCCITCNAAKRKMSKDKFLSWVKRVYEHSVKTKDTSSHESLSTNSQPQTLLLQ